MGAGNKLDPTRFEVTDIYRTSVCPLAKVMRHECKKRGIKKLKVVYSTEMPIRPSASATPSHETPVAVYDSSKAANPPQARRSTPGSIAYVPSVAGLILAGEVIKDLINS